MSASGGGDAGFFAAIAAVFVQHPIAAVATAFFILAVLALRKEGLGNRIIGLLESRAKFEADRENRRLEMFKILVEQDRHPMLPGMIKEEEE